MKKAALGALIGLAAMAAHAGRTEQLESSAVVNGTIVLARDGTVQLAKVNDEDKYGKAIAGLVRQTALTWRFAPVERDGVPVVAKASMHVRVVLRKAAGGQYSARIKGATFGGEDKNSTDELHETNQQKILPRYPRAAIKYRVQGTVYLALRIDGRGHVTAAVAEQVNLQNMGSEHLLKQFRELLAKAALEPARKWTFRVPTTGRLAKQDSWTVHEPVVFELHEMGASKPERVWKTYVPGPYMPAPWIDRPDMASVDALADDGMRTEGAGPALN